MSVGKKTLFVALGAVVTGVLVLLAAWRIEDNHALEQGAVRESTPITVQTVCVGTGEVSRWVLGEGIAEAVRKQHLQFETSGKVEFIALDSNGAMIREGSRVRGPAEGERFGQLLARLDLRDRVSASAQGEADLAAARNNVQSASAALAKARTEQETAARDFERKRQLFTKGILPRDEFEKVRDARRNAATQVESASAQLAAAQARVRSEVEQLNIVNRGQEKNSLHAPFDGVVARIDIRIGEYMDPDVYEGQGVTAQNSPMTIIDPSEMEVTLNMPVYEGRYVRVGQKAVIAAGALDWLDSGSSTEGHDDHTHELNGAVYSVSPQLTANRRSARIRVRFHQQNNDIPDGMIATCWIAIEHKTNALRIPTNSLLYDKDMPYVFVVEKGIAVRRDVRLGIEDEQYVEVRDGVSRGERIVTKGRRALKAGDHVRMVEETS